MPDIRILRLRAAGMFSNVNEVVEQVRLAKLHGYQFVIDWSDSCYNEMNEDGDPWGYYFEPCYSGLPELAELGGGEKQYLKGGEAVACSADNIITPRVKDGQCSPLLLPRDRVAANRLIESAIFPKLNITEQVDQFRKRHFPEQVIGVHIRGPGRTDGGVPELRAKFRLEYGVPIDLYSDRISEALKRMPKAKLFICSDSAKVIAKMQERFNEKVVCFDALRSEFGEMHAGHRQNRGLVFPPRTLGQDVVIEAYLLARTDFFVHGNSNVANFVLCRAPALTNDYVYGPVDPAS